MGALGEMTGTNHKVFKRLFAGQGMSLTSAERATNWLNRNWPKDVPWPRAVRRAAANKAAAETIAGIAEGFIAAHQEAIKRLREVA